MIAFWKYDTFPFCLWGELVDADETTFKVKGYEGLAFGNKSRIAFLPEVQANEVISRLQTLIEDKKAMDAKFLLEAKKVLNGIS